MGSYIQIFPHRYPSIVNQKYPNLAMVVIKLWIGYDCDFKVMDSIQLCLYYNKIMFSCEFIYET